MMYGCAVVVPWHNERQRDEFLEGWALRGDEPWLVMQHDKDKEGSGVTKNKGVRRAMEMDANFVIVLDDDCFPSSEAASMSQLVQHHHHALQAQPVDLFEPVTSPHSRGTPYSTLQATLPVAASMGFWYNVPDYCAVRQLTHGTSGSMEFKRKTMYQRYFPLCGMNIAFNPHEWGPWCQFIDVPRFDDIWMGWLWQKEAYRRNCCFNLQGPNILHLRQSNVWQNLRDEANYLEENETLWREIAMHPATAYEELVTLLPTHSTARRS
jgi:hypothetical protein